MRIARADDPVASEENAAAEETRVARALASCAPSASEASTATLSAKDAPGRVASALLRTFPSVADVRVGVRKPHVAVEGVLESLGVEVFRSRVGDRLP